MAWNIFSAGPKQRQQVTRAQFQQLAQEAGMREQALDPEDFEIIDEPPTVAATPASVAEQKATESEAWIKRMTPKAMTQDQMDAQAAGVNYGDGAATMMPDFQRGVEERRNKEKADYDARKQAYEQALQSDEFIGLSQKYGPENADLIIGRRIYPESAKAMDELTIAATSAIPVVGKPLAASLGAIRAWDDNKANGRGAQAMGAFGSGFADATDGLLSTVAKSLPPMVRYPAQLASGVFSSTVKDGFQKLARGEQPTPSDLPEKAVSESKKMMIEDMVSRIISSVRR